LLVQQLENGRSADRTQGGQVHGVTIKEEAVIVAFRCYTLLPLDDCPQRATRDNSHLTRSSLHPCLQRHGISRLPEVDNDKPVRATFKAYPIG
jgi:hypothetical protein